MKGIAAALALILAACACEPAQPPPMPSHERAPKPPTTPQDLANKPLPWPPLVGQPYPDLTLTDGAGGSVLLSGFKGKGAFADDARRWAAHFKPGGFKNRPVLSAGQGMISKASAELIPGFQLVDKNFILRYDAAGPHMKHGWHELFPAIPRLLAEQ